MNQSSGTKLAWVAVVCGVQPVMYPERKIVPVSVLSEAVKTINFIKSHSLSTHFFEGLFDLGSELSLFILEGASFLLEGRVDRLWLFRTWVFGRFSWKWIKQDCYFKENNGQHLLSVIKIELWSEKTRNLENLYLPPRAWWLPSIPSSFVNLIMIKCSFFKKIFWIIFTRSVGLEFITRSSRVIHLTHWASQAPRGCTSWYCVRKVPTFGKESKNQYFSGVQYMMWQNHAWVLLWLLFKVEDRAMTFNVAEFRMSLIWSQIFYHN